MRVRVQWIDATKGLSIILVTLNHAVSYAKASNIDPQHLESLCALLAPLRMPLFFAAAGLTAGSLRNARWRDLWEKRIALYLWLFGLWTAINLFLFSLIRDLRNPTFSPTFNDYVKAWWMPGDDLWFLWCLVLFIAINRIFCAKTELLLIISLLLSAVFFVLGELYNIPLAYRNFSKYLFFFSIFNIYRDEIIALISHFRVFFSLGIIIFILGAVGSFYTDGSGLSGFLKFLSATFGVLSVFSIISITCERKNFVAGSLEWLGRNTLPLYLPQILILSIIYHSLQYFSIPRPLFSPAIFLSVLIFSTSAFLMHNFFIKANLIWFYRCPEIFRSGSGRKLVPIG